MSVGCRPQHLLRQVVQDVAVAAGELLDELRDVAPPLQRQRRELQTGYPAFGALGQSRDDVFGKIEPGRGRDQLARLAESESEVGGAQLGRLASRAEPGQRQRWVAAAGHHQLE
jgi:hypothetical protein